ncbi:MAG: hypothetical protein ACFE8L_05460 [Candidatus Hodarchaeota archaeon]
MLKRKNIITVFTAFMLVMIIFSLSLNPTKTNYMDTDNTINPTISADFEGAENVIATIISRNVNMSNYGLVDIYDSITFKNLNNNPITSVFIGIQLNRSDDLIFFKATGKDGNTLLTERSYMIMNGYELIAIYFSSPLLPHQSKSILFTQTYENYLIYEWRFSEGNFYQYVQIISNVFPTLPYKSEGSINAAYNLPKDAGLQEQSPWASINPILGIVSFNFNDISSEIGSDTITPFLENLNDKKEINITYTDTEHTKLEIEEINREIFISPWGIIKVKEDITIENLGVQAHPFISLKVPRVAKNVYVSDNLGEILGTTIGTIANPNYKELNIDLLANRVSLAPNSTFKFELEYYLPFEKYISLNWFQESVKIDILTTLFDYLGRKQTIRIVIDGCYNIDFITDPPESIEGSSGTKVIVYKLNNISPLERKLIQFTFTIDLFDMLLRPIILILALSSIMSLYVVLTKSRRRAYDETGFKEEFIPVNEIREFCSLYEEKNALALEIRQAEEDAKRKKMAKKNYQNILSKNTSKIEQIQQEIVPFKKIMMETNETFNNIVKKLDVLEAERISVKDGLNLLETRYKRGRLPSREAYLKLSDNFKKRRKKIDRNINKFIQQLRSYLI